MATAYTVEDFWSAIRYLVAEGYCELTYDPVTGEEMIRICEGAESCEV